MQTFCILLTALTLSQANPVVTPTLPEMRAQGLVIQAGTRAWNQQTENPLNAHGVIENQFVNEHRFFYATYDPTLRACFYCNTSFGRQSRKAEESR